MKYSITKYSRGILNKLVNKTGFVANSKYKIKALLKDFQGPKLHFSSTKIIDKKPYSRHGHSTFRLQRDTEVYYTVLTNTVMIKASDRLSTNAKFQNLQDLNSRIFKHLICFQALSRALKFLFQIQAFSRISQACYEPWMNPDKNNGNVSRPLLRSTCVSQHPRKEPNNFDGAKFYCLNATTDSN